ncbi:MAG TPA: 4-hydroxythreonine-4-phosphate dehydrogenase PdxA [Casimicrobiaceae bacterium]|nr:4-hydroxythreonine-4-phosphate dehydrogenase PdxA [Casimicrobiaceae bacterium]
MSRPRIAYVAGDPNGIGPELSAKLLARRHNVEAAEVIVFSDPAIIASGERVAGVKALVGRANDGATLRTLNLAGESAITPGVATEAGGRAALAALESATAAARSGEVQAIVFAPLNKHALRLAGMHHEDELRLMQDRFGVDAFVTEFNITGKLWTSRVTSHVPLREVADALTIDGVVQAVEIVDRYLKAAGREEPRIAVTGLNPHAGDGGSIGREEIDVIMPAIEQAQTLGINAVGPMSPDTVFVAARRGDFDAVVTMYHDQGQIAMKLMGFDNGVTLHGGLPVPVATCASGTAFDIVGRNVANVEGLQQAFEIAVAIASRAR